MPLINCPECGHQISDKAEICPKCGYPFDYESASEMGNKQNYHNNTKGRTILIIGCLLAVGLVIGCFIFYKTTIIGDKADDTVEITPEFAEKVNQYDGISVFSDGRAAVCRNGKWGFINANGDEVITCKYDLVGNFSEDRAVAYRGDTAVYINRDGKEMFEKKGARLGSFSEGLAYVNDQSKVYVIRPNGDVAFEVTCKIEEEPFSQVLTQMTFCNNNLKGASFTYPLSLSEIGEDSKHPVFQNGIITIPNIGNYTTSGESANSFGNDNTDSPQNQYSLYEQTYEDESGHRFVRYGVKSKNGAIVIKPKYDFIQESRLTPLGTNGVFLTALHEKVFSEANNEISRGKYYFGFIDLDGNSTFSKEIIAHIDSSLTISKEHQRQFNEAKQAIQARECRLKEIESARVKQSLLESINGRWEWSGRLNGMSMNFYIIFDSNKMKYLSSTNGDKERGSFKYVNYDHTIRCYPNGSEGYAITYEVDPVSGRITLGNGHYLRKSID